MKHLHNTSKIINRIEELERILTDAHQENEEGHNLTIEEYILAIRSDQSPAHAHRYWEEACELLQLREQNSDTI